MSDMVPTAAVVDAGKRACLCLRRCRFAEVLAALAPYTTPARFRHSCSASLQQPDGQEWLKHKHDAYAPCS
jgi:hypothetical protein